MPKETISVLLIDDDIADSRLVITLLSQVKSCSFKVDHIDNINEARLHLAADKHDIYLIDYFLGDSSAIDLIREARLLECETPIIVITGADSEDIDAQVIGAGAADFLPKEELSASLLERAIKHAIERKKYIRQLEYLANRDPLTNLANRSMFEEQLEQAIALAKRRNLKFAVLLLDLDRFKEINDTLGHNVGDVLLTLVSHRLKKLMRKEDIIARIGGDEFTILLSQVDNVENIAPICEKILNGLKEPTPINDSNLVISTSIGVAVYPGNGESPVSLMQNADLALYKAKALGKNNYQFFSEDLQKRLQFETELEKGIRQAIIDQSFYLHYQPQIDLATGKIVAFEALARWQHPSMGYISPDKFISIAEKSGLIIELGDWITEAACKQLQAWNQGGFSNIRMAVNMSPKQFRKRNFFTWISELLNQYCIVADMFELEVTESIFVETSNHNLKFFKQLQSLGVHLAIDDFGTGYSSLAYLKNFPVNKLKIDRSFVSGDSAGQEERFITQAIITLGHGLGMEIIAEGVETKEQAQLLLQQGCNIAQGYWYSRPLPPEEATALLKKSYRQVIDDAK